jgi:hypothetical protein
LKLPVGLKTNLGQDAIQLDPDMTIHEKDDVQGILLIQGPVLMILKSAQGKAEFSAISL